MPNPPDPLTQCVPGAVHSVTSPSKTASSATSSRRRAHPHRLQYLPTSSTGVATRHPLVLGRPCPPRLDPPWLALQAAQLGTGARGTDR